LLNDLAGLALAESDEAGLMRALRVAKRRAHLTIAIADIAGLWQLKRITRALSDFSDAAVAAATSHLLRLAHGGGELELPHPEQPMLDSGLIILGLGKLGARELNYSSDIDLIVLFDLDRVRYRGARRARILREAARGLVRLLQDATQDGYVLRVRPAPAARSLFHPARHVDHRGRDLLRGHGPELGTRRDDQGARHRRRRDGGQEFLRNLRPSSGASISTSPRSRTSIPSSGRSMRSKASQRRGRGPQHQGRPRRHPRDRVLRPDPAADLGRRNPDLRTRATLDTLEGLVASAAPIATWPTISAPPIVTSAMSSIDCR
jgi:glutamate-ammonia-ligase adenylyltransferase